ncbi:GNAT family N-acetyltransferase [Phyllobacterium leguminum]|uniref:Acetyltransferase (GNAT) family protein n=1 Tax=Phyllobacterium leguminum TaxID=314237 RepID=A0A318T4S5_9HYPH|nr:GNAT family N-acetyltransferase [Phyllobacterium leguminum]PYE87176.1 acetyltransferase (GNAT) family protein [Phyllobacterium leguminum]
MEISNLRSYPDMADIIADRCWNAWWTETEVSLTEYRAHLEPMIAGNEVPVALIAHDQGEYLGSVLLIENDLDDRQQYTPWIAALWVEPESRRQGIAAKLIEAARREAAFQGYGLCYLCATPDNTPYYIARGFEQIETDVSGLNIFTIGS